MDKSLAATTVESTSDQGASRSALPALPKKSIVAGVVTGLVSQSEHILDWGQRFDFLHGLLGSISMSGALSALPYLSASALFVSTLCGGSVLSKVFDRYRWRKALPTAFPLSDCVDVIANFGHDGPVPWVRLTIRNGGPDVVAFHQHSGAELYTVDAAGTAVPVTTANETLAKSFKVSLSAYSVAHGPKVVLPSNVQAPTVGAIVASWTVSRYNEEDTHEREPIGFAWLAPAAVMFFRPKEPPK